MKRFCLALDLKPEAELIAEYETHHKKIWPEIEASIKSAGIISMQIYRTGNRLFMVMETTDNFSFDAKSKSDAANPIVQQWEELMWKYQQALPGSQPGEKWKLMDKIFEL
ncbi:MAG: L-rhamnose mutarotase [Cyclobacteriaceae bacterium]|nr:L-rhamnose mutarotase [Cyclobacteriaceae bacterium]